MPLEQRVGGRKGDGVCGEGVECTGKVGVSSSRRYRAAAGDALLASSHTEGTPCLHTSRPLPQASSRCPSVASEPPSLVSLLPSSPIPQRGGGDAHVLLSVVICLGLRSRGWDF